jgi:hypothetical protein
MADAACQGVKIVLLPPPAWHGLDCACACRLLPYVSKVVNWCPHLPLCCPADYRVPVVLRVMGVLQYSQPLAEKVCVLKNTNCVCVGGGGGGGTQNLKPSFANPLCLQTLLGIVSSFVQSLSYYCQVSGPPGVHFVWHIMMMHLVLMHMQNRLAAARTGC